MVSGCTIRLIQKQLVMIEDRLNEHMGIVCRVLSPEGGVKRQSLDVELNGMMITVPPCLCSGVECH